MQGRGGAEKPQSPRAGLQRLTHPCTLLKRPCLGGLAFWYERLALPHAANGRSDLAEEKPGLDPLPEDARLDSLDERLQRAKSEEAIRNGGADKGQDDYNLGNRVLAELIGGMAGGALIGWVLDRFLGTSPWLLLAMLFMGIIVAFRNIIRISNKRSK